MNMSFYVGALGANNCTRKLNVISNNLANVNNAGFKPKTASFSELVNYNMGPEGNATAGSGMKVRSTSTSFETSAFTPTGGEYDYAIADSNAFFMVQDPVSGANAFTRNGQFHRGEWEDEFYLMTQSGKLVLDQNQEPLKADVIDTEKLLAEMEEGYEEEYDDYDSEEDENKPKLSLYTFNNPSRLVSIGDNEYVPVGEDAEAILVERPALVGGSLEASGTDIAKELTRLIECQRAFSYAARMVTTSDEIEGVINSLRG